MTPLYTARRAPRRARRAWVPWALALLALPRCVTLNRQASTRLVGGSHYGRLTHEDGGCDQHTVQRHELVGGALGVVREEPSGAQVGLTATATGGSLRDAEGFTPDPRRSPYKVFGATLWGGFSGRYLGADLGVWGLTSPQGSDMGVLWPWLTLRAGELSLLWVEGQLGPREAPVGGFLLAAGAGARLPADDFELHLRLLVGPEAAVYLDQRPGGSLHLAADGDGLQVRLDARLASDDGWGVGLFTSVPAPAAGLSLSFDLDR